MARCRLRVKAAALQEAFTGFFADHHAFLLQRMLTRVDVIDADVEALDAGIEQQVESFTSAVERLAEIPGVNPVAALVILSEIGVDMSRFPTSGHLVS
ncbi:transposase [[Kitasatospora] papulosa]|uniref:transposase n=1 Tax=[Kitasatospora] papulosa TaxID=1464011 RepID=UPI003688B5FE